MPTPAPFPGPDQGWAVLALVALAVGTVLVGTRPVLRRLPEPDEPDGKPAYAALATRRLVAVCAVLAGGAAALVGLLLPAALWPLWWVLCAPALVLVAVDARTTWLPLPLTRLVQAAAVGAGLLTGLLGGLDVLVRAAVGGVAAGLLYLLLWRLSGRTLGFGDVRLAPVLGAAGAAAGWSTLFAALLLGSLLGAVVGLVLRARGRPGAFAYAPSMLAGAFAAVLVGRLVGLVSG